MGSFPMSEMTAMTAMSAILLHSPSYGLGHVSLLLTGFFECLIDAEAGRLLARRELLEGLEVLGHDGLGRHQEEGAIGHPLVIEESCVEVGAFERIAAHVEDLWHPQADKRFLPDTQTLGTLLQKMNLPLIDAQRHQVAVVAPVHEPPARIRFHFPFQERQQVVTVEVYLEGLLARLVSLLGFFHDVRLPGGGHPGRKHVAMGAEIVRDSPRLADAPPADSAGHAPAAFVI